MLEAEYTSKSCQGHSYHSDLKNDYDYDDYCDSDDYHVYDHSDLVTHWNYDDYHYDDPGDNDDH